MSEVLEPCRFCGGEAHVVTNTISVNGKVIHADYQIRHMCDVFGLMISRYYGTKADAIDVWNRRTRDHGMLGGGKYEG